MKTKTIILMMILVFISLAATDILYSEMNDKTDRLSQNQSNVFSPGYINAAKQKTESIIGQLDPKKSFMEKVVEYVQNKVSNKVMEDSTDKVQPELKKKTGGSGETVAQDTGTYDNAEVLTAVDSTEYNVKIGTGTSQKRDANGKIISEIINNKRHIYVGFDNFGTSTIKDAMEKASAGDIIIARSGSYDLGGSYIYMKNGVSLYGGYNNKGERDLISTPTVISNGGIWASNIDKATEINGLTIKNPYGRRIGDTVYRPSYYGVYTSNSTNDLKIMNNTIISGFMGIMASNSKAIIFNNSISGSSWSAIYTTRSSLLVTNNRLYNTVFGVTETYYSSSTFQNNVVWGNYTNFIIHGQSTSIVDSNTIYGGSEGVRYHSSSPTITNNIFVKTPQLFRIYDSNMGANQIIANGNVFYGYTTVGINTSILSQGSNQNNLFTDPGLIDPSKGVYSASLLDKGYSTKNITVDYNKVIIGSSIGQNVAKAVSENIGVGTAKDSKNVLGDNNLNPSNISSYASSASDYIKGANSKSLGNALKSLLMGKSSLALEGTSNAEQALLLNDNTREFALAIPAGVLKEGSEWGNGVLILTNILNNPTEDQKLLIDAAKGIMKIEDGSGSPELKKASDDLLQMVASILLAQAIPDLFKEGDVANIKAIFTELNTTKNRIMLEYQDATKPYYSEIVKEMSKNMAILQLKNMLSSNMSKEQLEKLPPNELDKILEKLRQAKDKSLEEEHILHQEAKYRSLYIEPNKKMLEDNMKHMLEGFTKELSGVLEKAEPAKK